MNNSYLQFLKRLTLIAVLMLSYNIMDTNGQNCLYKLITQIACENTNAVISCSPARIRILSVFYGRFDATTCGGPAGNTNCVAVATSMVMPIWNGTTSCTIPATSGLVGYDPCSGTLKYLTINYLCY